MNMRDRLAKVIGTKLLEFEQWELTKGEAMEIADAVLDEIMTPTEAMLNAAGGEGAQNLKRAIFGAMIKAAKDGK